MVLICWNPQSWWGVLYGSWCCTLIAADLCSVPSHFVTQAHVQNLSSHRIYETCRVSPGRFRANAVAVISLILCSGLFWQLIVRWFTLDSKKVTAFLHYFWFCIVLELHDCSCGCLLVLKCVQIPLQTRMLISWLTFVNKQKKLLLSYIQSCLVWQPVCYEGD